MKQGMYVGIVGTLLLWLTASARAQVTYTDEAAYLNDLVNLGYGTLQEGFEDDATWGVARFPNAAPAVSSQGITWTANNLTSQISTSGGPARTGLWAVFALPHGITTGDPGTPQRDGFIGTSTAVGPLVGVGVWLTSNTGGAEVQFILDGIPTTFPDPTVSNAHKFFGVIDTAGFTTFEIVETQGTVEDQKYIFADDFRLGTAPPELEGSVRFIGAPCAPGTPPIVPPCDGPYPNYEITIYKDDSVTVETVTYSDENGDYRTGLSSGDYIIYTPNGILSQQANLVSIVEGETTTLDLVIDIGIRYVVPPVYSDVGIDIMPYRKNNSINLRRSSRIPVAIFSTSDFYAPKDVNRSSLTFGRTGDETSLSYCQKHPKDVDNDGLPDLLCLFSTQEAGFQCNNTEGILRGLRPDGTPLEGRNFVKIKPCRQSR